MLPHSWTDFLNQRSVTRPTQRRSILVHAEELESRLTPASVVSVADQTFNLAAGIAGFQVTRTGTVADAIDATYTISDGSALSGSNYTASTPGSVHFNAGQTVATIPLSILPNNFAGANRTFSVDLTGADTTTSFADQQALVPGNFIETVTDINGDGKPDLVVKYDNSNLGVELNTTPAGAGTPTFATAATPFRTNVTLGGTIAADLDGDGRPDLVAVNYDRATVNSLAVLRNLTPAGGSPAFAAPQRLTIPGLVYDVTAADINGDGKLDLVVAGRNGVTVLLNTTAGPGNPTFAAPVTFSVPNAATSVIAADINGDGKLDLVANIYAGNPVVLLNATVAGAATPSFAAPVEARFSFTSNPNGSIPTREIAVDVNGDGRPDLIDYNFDSKQELLINTTPAGSATPTFAPPQLIMLGLFANRQSPTAVVDVNGDGRPDIIAGSEYGTAVFVYTNTTPPGSSTATFAGPLRLRDGINGSITFGGGGPLSLFVADLNADGLPDIVSSNQDEYLRGEMLGAVLVNTTTNALGIRHATVSIDPAPYALSIVPAGPFGYTVTFSEPVRGLSAADFTAGTGTIGTPTTADGGRSYFVPVARGSAPLTLFSRAGISDFAGNQLYQTATDNGSTFSGIASQRHHR